MKRKIFFVKRMETICARNGYSMALSTRYDGWGGLHDNHGQHTMILVVYE